MQRKNDYQQWIEWFFETNGRYPTTEEENKWYEGHNEWLEYLERFD